MSLNVSVYMYGLKKYLIGSTQDNIQTFDNFILSGPGEKVAVEGVMDGLIGLLFLDVGCDISQEQVGRGVVA